MVRGENCELWRPVPATIETAIGVFNGIGRDVLPSSFWLALGNVDWNGYTFENLGPNSDRPDS